MGRTTEAGEIGEAAILADIRRQGHGVAIPFGHSLPFDLIVIRHETGALERVQCKYTTSDGKVVRVVVGSHSAWVGYRYTAQMVDWMAVYDATTNRCFYIPAWTWDGQTQLNLRLAPTANGQKRGVRFAFPYETLAGEPQQLSASGRVE